MNKKITLDYKSLLIIILAGLLVFLSLGKLKNFLISDTQKDTHTIDSTKKNILVPERNGNIEVRETKPTIIIMPSNNSLSNSKETNDLLSLFKTMSDKQTDLEKLLLIIAKKTYVDPVNDSMIKGTITTIVENGKKKSLQLDYTIKESYVQAFEKTHTYKLKPKAILSIGGGLNYKKINNDFLQSINPKVTIGLKLRKTNNFNLSIDAAKRVDFIYTKDIFTKY